MTLASCGWGQGWPGCTPDLPSLTQKPSLSQSLSRGECAHPAILHYMSESPGEMEGESKAACQSVPAST